MSTLAWTQGDGQGGLRWRGSERQRPSEMGRMDLDSGWCGPSPPGVGAPCLPGPLPRGTGRSCPAMRLRLESDDYVSFTVSEMPSSPPHSPSAAEPLPSAALQRQAPEVDVQPGKPQDEPYREGAYCKPGVWALALGQCN